MTTSYVPTSRTTLKRLPKRGVFDRETVHRILDEGLFCHLGFVAEGQPYVLPTIYARVEETLYVHGSAASRMMGTLAQGVPVCLTVTLLDGLVLARSAFHHSMNYRSVVVLGTAEEVKDAGEKRRALDAIVDHVAPRPIAARRGDRTTTSSLATRVLSLPLDEVSAKVRTGPPIDDEEDSAWPVWAGVLPLRLVPQPLVADPGLDAKILPSPVVTGWKR